MAALACLAVGQAFIFLRWRPLTDYYFLLVWVGYILLVDELTYRRRGRSLIRHEPVRFLVSFPLSATFWWIFELYNQVVQNWVYLGPDDYDGIAYVLLASVFFSTVLPAVWETADLLMSFLAPGERPALGQVVAKGGRSQAYDIEKTGHRDRKGLSRWVPALGAVLSVMPLIAPAYAFPLVWLGLFVLLDPVNERAGRPSILRMISEGQWRVPVAFYLGTTATGFFWELWNYWAWPKWAYTLHPIIGEMPRLFEMPLPGYLGYGPFGWELFAMWWFCMGIWERLRGRGTDSRPITDGQRPSPRPSPPS